MHALNINKTENVFLHAGQNKTVDNLELGKVWWGLKVKSAICFFTERVHLDPYLADKPHTASICHHQHSPVKGFNLL